LRRRIDPVHHSFPCGVVIPVIRTMEKIDEHIAALREGNTLTENEVKALCEKVREF
jgi:hypothetical protein